jgi:preprotein translocase subunit SecG
MGFVIGLLTLLMALDCIVLIFLVLIQLPKKEAGAGLAFGGAASDALFGAGSGNVLTKITKYVAGIFFAMAIVLSVMQTHVHSRASNFEQRLTQPPSTPTALPPAASAPATPPASPAAPVSNAATAAGGNLLMRAPATAVESNNLPAPAPATTNAQAAAPPKYIASNRLWEKT